MPLPEPAWKAASPEPESSVETPTLTPFDPPERDPRLAPVPGEIGHGVLGRGSKAIYWYLVLSAMLVLAALPSIAIAMFLPPTPGNFPLIALAMVPLGPALSAALYTVRARYLDEDAGPFRAFWRGYRRNFFDVLKLWVPALAILGILAFNLTFGGFIGLGTAYRVALSLLAALIGAWALHALALATFFHFRTPDIARLAAYYLATMPKATFGALALVVIAVATAWGVQELALAVIGGVLVWFWYQNVRPILNHAYRRFAQTVADD